MRRPESKLVGFNPRLWLIGGVGGLVSFGFLIRLHTQHRGLRTGTDMGAPNSATVAILPMLSGHDDGPISPELVLVDPALRAHLALCESGLPETVEPLHAKADVVASTDVPPVRIVSGYDDSPVGPEPVLVDPVVPSNLAMRESVLLEIVEPPHAETAAVDPTDPPEVPIVSGYNDGTVSPQPALADPAVRTQIAGHAPRRIGARRLLTVAAAAVALSAAGSFGVFVGLLLSGDRIAALSEAAATPPPPPASPKATAATAGKTANPAVSTRPRITHARTTSATSQAGVSGASSSRLLAWAPVANATAYTVEITRNGASVYSATTSVPNVRVPKRWRRDGHTMRFSPGTYHWYVWPVVRNGATTRKLPAAVVASKLEISP